MGVVGELLVRLGVEEKDFNKGLGRMKRQLKELGRDVTEIGKVLSIGLSAPLAGLAVAAIRSSDEMSTAFKDFGAAVKTSLGEMGREIGKAIDLEGILRSLAGAVREGVEAFKSLPDFAKTFLVVVGGLVVVLGPLVTLFGKMITALGSLVGAFKALAILVGGLATGPFAALIAAAAALAGGIAYLGFKFLPVNDQLEEAARRSKELADNFGLIGKKLSQAKINEEFNRIQRELGVTDERMKEIMADLPGMLARSGEFAESFQHGLKHLQAFILTQGELSDQWEKMPVAPERFFSTFSEGLQAGLNSLIQFSAQGIGTIKPALVSLGNGLAEAGRQAFEMNHALEIAWREMVNTLKVTYTNVMGTLQEVASALFQGIGDALGELAIGGGNLGEIFQALWKRLQMIVISMIAQLTIQLAIFTILGKILDTSIGVSHLATLTALAVTAALVDLYAKTGPLIGTLAAPAVVAATVGAVGGSFLKGKAIGAVAGRALLLAEGGILNKAALVQVAEVPRARPEMVSPLSKLKDLLSGTEAVHLQVLLDGDPIKDVNIPKLRGYMRI
ncbi:MAG: hypothetical protein HY725_17100 [Candidatus Rokubacteria bacterium]|nr:hypothetical protein [Candidatus Rokubacteria bacterium]